jgi:hypothetical protein
MTNIKFDNIVTSDEFKNFFEGNMTDDIDAYIRKLNLRYRDLKSTEYRAIKNEYYKFFAKEIVRSGKKRKQVWENGWNQNLLDVLEQGVSSDTLLPYYYKKNEFPLRFKGKYIYPEDPEFVIKFLSIIQKILSKQYFGRYKNIYEFGCGPFHNIYEFSLNTINKNYHGLDWSEATIEISRIIEERKSELGVGSHVFSGTVMDFFDPDYCHEMKDNSIIFTFGCMEQLGGDFNMILEYFLRQKCKNFLHIEPINELYSRDIEFDDLAFRYSVKRGYLTGFFSKLRDLEGLGKIRIHCCNKIIGNRFHDVWTFLRWERISD